VFCGQDFYAAVAHRYCSTRCAVRQLDAILALLNSTPREALSVQDWHDLSVSYATELELLTQVAM